MDPRKAYLSSKICLSLHGGDGSQETAGQVAPKEVIAELSNRTLGLAFVDPEGFEATFKMFQAFATRRIDVLFLFPSGIGITRNLRIFAKQPKSPMDDLWGGKEWRDLPPAKLAAGKRLTAEEALCLDQPWVLRFRSKMASIRTDHLAGNQEDRA